MQSSGCERIRPSANCSEMAKKTATNAPVAKSVSIRLVEEHIARAQKVLEAMEADPKLAGVPLSLSRALVMMTVRGLQAFEQDYGLGPKPKKR